MVNNREMLIKFMQMLKDQEGTYLIPYWEYYFNKEEMQELATCIDVINAVNRLAALGTSNKD